MRLHYIQHVPFENPGSILEWARRKGMTITSTFMFENQNLPALDEFDMLAVMGGPMGVGDKLPFQEKEFVFVEKAVAGG